MRSLFVKNPIMLYLSGALILTLISISSRLKLNGSILGLDYNLFYPDGMYYSQKALELSGTTPQESANIVAKKYISLNPGMSEYRDESQIQIANRLLDKESQTWNFVNSRIFYPLISSIFVKLIGINGMLIFPIVSYILLAIGIQVIGLKLNNPFIALVLIFTITTSLTIPRWMVSNLTDPILAGIFALIPLIFLYVKKEKNIFLMISLLIGISSVTRFALPVWIGILFVMYLRKYSKSMLIKTGIFTIFVSIYPIVTSYQSVQNGYKSDENLLNQLFQIVIQSVKVLTVEIAQLGVLDRPLLAMLLISLLVSILRFKSISAQMCLATLVGCTILELIPGVVGVNFRYYLPALPFACWSIIENARSLRKA
jgi:hypothetical protein